MTPSALPSAPTSAPETQRPVYQVNYPGFWIYTDDPPPRWKHLLQCAAYLAIVAWPLWLVVGIVALCLRFSP